VLFHPGLVPIIVAEISHRSIVYSVNKLLRATIPYIIGKSMAALILQQEEMPKVPHIDLKSRYISIPIVIIWAAQVLWGEICREGGSASLHHLLTLLTDSQGRSWSLSL